MVEMLRASLADWQGPMQPIKNYITAMWAMSTKYVV